MNNQDNFYNIFKQASQHAEENRFDAFDPVWSRVEEKLEERNKKRILPYWKWVAVAASIIGLITAGWWIFNTGTHTNQVHTLTSHGDKVSTPRPPQGQASANEHTAYDTTKNSSSKKQQNSSTGVTHLPTGVHNIEQPIVVSTNKSTLNTIPAIAIKKELQSISGAVIDSIGKPIQYASIWIDGTKRGTTTDSLGHYQLLATAVDTLNIIAIGFNAFKTPVAALSPSISLNATNQSLNEVVVGYGKKIKEKNIASSVTSIVATPNSFAKMALQGKVAGVQVNQSMDKRVYGYNTIASNIKIRGTSSIQSNTSPLYVVNGEVKPADYFNKIAIDNIDKIEVLKEAAAQSLYGSMATDGVVFITTKDISGKGKERLDKLKRKLGDSVTLFPFTMPATMQLNMEAYPPLVENPFKLATHEPLSTFSLDVDNASYSNIRRFINNGQPVPKDAVRIEEMVNYFSYKYPQPQPGEPFGFYTEYSDAPWNAGHKLLLVGMRAKDIAEKELPANNLVFLIDVSGSMNSPNKLPLLKSSFPLLVKNLREQDKVSIVVYAGTSGVVLPTTSGDKKETILAALEKLSAGGSTAGGEGIELAYKIAAEQFIKGGNNRVILATDGDFNVGVSSREELQKLIEEKRKTGVFLTCLGYGMGNYKDVTLETLANKGNGNYAYIDNMLEATRFLDKEFKGNMYTVAKDVKLQIEFNPQHVQAYRLIGYEDRLLKNEDFVNDTVDAGDVGAGHTVTALYEIIPVGVKSSFLPKIPELKYSKRLEGGSLNELATIKYRYKKPSENNSHEKQTLISASTTPLSSTSEDYRFATAVAWWGLHLRQSQLITIDKLSQIIEMARSAKTYDPDGFRAEMVRLAEATK